MEILLEWKSHDNFNKKDMKANNYEVVEAGETIKFRGIVQRSVSQAFFLVFCTALAFLSLGLVLQIQFQDLGKDVPSYSRYAKVACSLLTLYSPIKPTKNCL